MEYSNEELIRKIANGDETAFNLLYDKYYRMVYFVAYKTMHNEADAQDVVQEVFLQIHNSIHTVYNPQYLQLWINRITVNKCNMLYRKRKELLFEENDKDPLMQYVETDVDFLPREHFRFNNDKEVINYFIDQLPPAQRLMIILMYFEQYSVDEIAMVCNIPSGTVKSRLKVARDTLRHKIELYEKKENVKLDFNEITMPALVTAALLQQSSNIRSAGKLKGIMQTNMKFIYTKAIVAGCLSIAVVCCSAVAVHVFQRNADRISENHYNNITAQEAYYKIAMWANTPALIEQKATDITEYQKYYEILKKEQGVYWNLFLTKGIVKYFE